MVVHVTTMCLLIGFILISRNTTSYYKSMHLWIKKLLLTLDTKQMRFSTDVFLISQQAIHNQPNLPLHNLLTYWKAIRWKIRKFDWEYQTKHLPKDLILGL